MKELSLHILDIVENSIRAQATLVEIMIDEDIVSDRYTITIRDNGSGMSSEQAVNVLDPFYTTRTTRRVGLGLPLLKSAAQQCEGKLEVNSKLGEGTIVVAEFKRSHWDRAPLGDMPGTIVALIASNPELELVYIHTLNKKVYSFDTREIRRVLEGMPINNPAVLDVLRRDIKEGLALFEKEP
jgi:hypothetical protein